MTNLEATVQVEPTDRVVIYILVIFFSIMIVIQY